MENIVKFCLVSAVFFVCGEISFAVQPKPYEPAERTVCELRARGGLPYFYKKLDEGKDVKIVYFGGSITEQAGWRILSEKYFKERFPKSKITAVGAAIGGTGSFLGVFRCDRDVISHSPDLVFVEFAVNDSGVSSSQIRATMEGIVRKIRMAKPDTDICFVYTFTRKWLKTLQDGKMYKSESVMEDVADYYCIPSINMCLEVARLEKEGKLVMAVPDAKMTAVSGKSLDTVANMPKDAEGRIIFSKDGVHPFPNTGHIFYMKALERSFAQMENMQFKARGTLPKAVDSKHFENASTLRADDPTLKYSGSFKNVLASPKFKGLEKRVDALMELGAGAELRFKFTGATLALYVLMGPRGCEFETIIDGKSLGSQRSVDAYCTYQRVQSFVLAQNLTDTVHEAIVKVLPTKFDKRAILFEQNKAFFDKRPDLYVDYVLDIAGIMTLGKVLK